MSLKRNKQHERLFLVNNEISTFLNIKKTFVSHITKIFVTFILDTAINCRVLQG